VTTIGYQIDEPTRERLTMAKSTLERLLAVPELRLNRFKAKSPTEILAQETTHAALGAACKRTILWLDSLADPAARARAGLPDYSDHEGEDFPTPEAKRRLDEKELLGRINNTQALPSLHSEFLVKRSPACWTATLRKPKPVNPIPQIWAMLPDPPLWWFDFFGKPTVMGPMNAVTVVIPTRNERDNIGPTIQRIASTLRDLVPFSILVVDDASTDGTTEMVELARDVVARAGGELSCWNHGRDRPHGLTQSILDGISAATTDAVIVCDGDGQHQYELIPLLIGALDHADIAIGARIERAHNQTGIHRRMLARAARSCTHRQQGRTADPMSGFFALVKNRVQLRETEFPKGYKALIEIMSWNPESRVADIPAALLPRTSGRSKVSLGVLWNSFRQTLCVR
jgi:hypothetical protein